jgi:hypothetical protein
MRLVVTMFHTVLNTDNIIYLLLRKQCKHFQFLQPALKLMSVKKLKIKEQNANTKPTSI